MPENAEFTSNEGNEFEDKVVVACLTGYEYNAGSTVEYECQADRTWIEPAIDCQRKILDIYTNNVKIKLATTGNFEDYTLLCGQKHLQQHA